jgi:hypothetical protein
MALAFGAVPDSQVGPVFGLKTSWLHNFIHLVEGFTLAPCGIELKTGVISKMMQEDKRQSILQEE